MVTVFPDKEQWLLNNTRLLWIIVSKRRCQNFSRKFVNGRSCACAVKIWLKIAINAVRLPKFETVNGISWSPRKIIVKDLRQRSGLAWFCACAESYVVCNVGPYTVLPDNSILIAANMQSETGFPSSHQLKSYVAYKLRLKLAARAVLSADAGLLVYLQRHCQSQFMCTVKGKSS